MWNLVVEWLNSEGVCMDMEYVLDDLAMAHTIITSEKSEVEDAGGQFLQAYVFPYVRGK